LQAAAFNGIHTVYGQGKQQVLILFFSIIARFHIKRSHLVLPPRNSGCNQTIPNSKKIKHTQLLM